MFRYWWTGRRSSSVIQPLTSSVKALCVWPSVVLAHPPSYLLTYVYIISTVDHSPGSHVIGKQQRTLWWLVIVDWWMLCYVRYSSSLNVVYWYHRMFHCTTSLELSRISSGTRPSVQTVSSVCLKRTCSLDTSAFSALRFSVITVLCKFTYLPNSQCSVWDCSKLYAVLVWVELVVERCDCGYM